MKSIMVGVPTHSGTLTSATTDTLLRLQQALLARGDRMEIEFYSGPVIADLRNAIVADFLSRDADHLLMIDSDMGALPGAIVRMIDLDRPLVGCLYPKRLFDFAQVRGASGSVDTLMTMALQFVGKLESRSEQRMELIMERGFARALHVGTGIMLIRRAVFDTLSAAFPDLRGRGFNAEAFAGPRFEQNWGFFNPLPIASGGSNLAEDFSFCARWRDTGGEIWADVDSTITHVGTHRFAASFIDYAAAHRAV